MINNWKFRQCFKMDKTEQVQDVAQIFQTLEKLFVAESITEYEVLPGYNEQDKSTPFVIEMHHLGVYKWCIKPLYTYAHRTFKTKSHVTQSEKLKFLTQFMLMVQPDHMSLWNARKLLIQKKIISFQEEIKLLNLILLQHPKSSEVYIHRRWLIQSMTVPDSSVIKFEFSLNECMVCQRSADKYANNYHAWNHRQWVIDTFLLHMNEQLLDSELESAEKFIDAHISDYSGYHHKIYIIRLKLALLNPKSLDKFIEEQVDIAEQLLLTYENHESLYIGYRGLLTLIYDYKPKNNVLGVEAMIKEDEWPLRREKFAARAVAFVHHLKSKQRSIWDVDLCRKFIKWCELLLDKKQKCQ